MSATYFHVGDKYGHLEVIAATNEREKHGGSIIWKFKCDCGNIVYRSTQAIKTSLIRGHVISCGCKNPMACDPEKIIGPKYAHDKNRIEKAVKGLGQINNTTMQGIDRKKLNKNNSTGVRGVSYNKSKDVYYAQITFQGKQYRQVFKEFDKAVQYRKYLEELYFEPTKEAYKEKHEWRGEGMKGSEENG